jgi:large repetitive protein
MRRHGGCSLGGSCPDSDGAKSRRALAGIVCRTWTRFAFLALLLCVLWLQPRLTCREDRIFLILPTAQADNAQYAYDALGRLIEVLNATTGRAVEYSYDPSGNIASTKAVPTSQLSIAGLSTTHGAPGGQITIYGTGFGTVAADDAVTFNGTKATVVSATSTQLVVSVPAGATSGPVSVTTKSAFAIILFAVPFPVPISVSTNFTVTPVVPAPTISAFSPAVAAPGTSITITGTGFDPAAANNKIQFGATSWTSATASTSTMLTTLFVAQGAWGKVRVLTPHGLAISTADFFSPPTGYTVSSIGSMGRLSAGTATGITLATRGQSSMQVFDGNAGDLLAIGVTNDTVASLTLKVFGPDGSLLTSGVITASGQGLQLPPLPRSGTYALVVDPANNTGAATLTLGAPVRAALTIGGSPVSIALSIPGQRALLSFAGTQGGYVSLALSSVTLSAARVSIIAPDGSTLLSNTLGTNGITFSPQLPSTGLFTVLVDPSGSISGGFAAALSSPPTPPLVANQSTYTLSISNQNVVTTTFRGSAGQYLTLVTSEMGGSIPGATISVLTPNGSQLTTTTLSVSACAPACGFNGTNVLNLGPLPSAGTYTVLVQQAGSNTGQLTLALSSPITGALSIGTSVTESVSLPAQSMQLTFTGASGQFLALAITETGSNIPQGTITVLTPTGTQLTTTPFSGAVCPQSCGFNASSVLNLGPLPSSGTYTVLMQQTAANMGSGQLTFTLSSPATAVLPLGTSTNESVSLPAQGMQVTFTGTAGQYLALVASEMSGTIPEATITVLTPTGAQLTTTTFSPSNCPPPSTPCGFNGSNLLNLGPLPGSGTYTVLVQQTASATGTLTFSVAAPVMIGAVPINGSALPAILQAPPPGQGILASFTGTAGQFLTLQIIQNQCGDTNGATVVHGSVAVLKPDGTQLTSGSLNTSTSSCGVTGGSSGSTMLNLGALPASGTYQILFQQTVAPGNTNATLDFSLVTPILAGPIAINGTAVATTLQSPSQAILANFSGTAGQFLSLAIVESQCGDTTGVTGVNGSVAVLNPDGTQLTSGSLNTSGNTCNGVAGASGSVVLNFGPLPATGTYQIIFQQIAIFSSLDATLNFNLAAPVVAGPIVINGSTIPVALQAPPVAQGILASFAGTAAQTVSLTVAQSQCGDTTVTSVSGSISVLKPDNSQLTSGSLVTGSCGASGGRTGSTTLNLGPLPVSGTYQVWFEQLVANSSLNAALNFSVTQ